MHKTTFLGGKTQEMFPVGGVGEYVLFINLWFLLYFFEQTLLVQ